MAKLGEIQFWRYKWRKKSSFWFQPASQLATAVVTHFSAARRKDGQEARQHSESNKQHGAHSSKKKKRRTENVIW